jgi:hypothetical protein
LLGELGAPNRWPTGSSRVSALAALRSRPRNRPEPASFGSLPNAIEPLDICHKLMRGFVDPHLPDWGAEANAVNQRLAKSLEPGMLVVRANKETSGEDWIREPFSWPHDREA